MIRTIIRYGLLLALAWIVIAPSQAEAQSLTGKWVVTVESPQGPTDMNMTLTMAGANLTGANLNGANLANADLTGANLSGASLEGTNLQGAVLDGCELEGTDLSTAKTDQRRNTPGREIADIERITV